MKPTDMKAFMFPSDIWGIMVNFDDEEIGHIMKAVYEDGCGKTHFFRCGMKAALTKYFDFSNIFSIFVQKVSLVTI